MNRDNYDATVNDNGREWFLAIARPMIYFADKIDKIITSPVASRYDVYDIRSFEKCVNKDSKG